MVSLYQHHDTPLVTSPSFQMDELAHTQELNGNSYLVLEPARLSHSTNSVGCLSKYQCLLSLIMTDATLLLLLCPSSMSPSFPWVPELMPISTITGDKSPVKFIFSQRALFCFWSQFSTTAQWFLAPVTWRNKVQPLCPLYLLSHSSLPAHSFWF